MYRVSPFVRHFAWSLAAGAGVATLWVNLAPQGYYDAIEWRLAQLGDGGLADWLIGQGGAPQVVTPAILVSAVLMPLFMAFTAKELWEALVLDRGALTGRRAIVPLMGVLGAGLGAVVVWRLVMGMTGGSYGLRAWEGRPLPIGGDIVLGYVIGRRLFGPRHPALHLLLMILIGLDILGLLALGLAQPWAGLRPWWLVLPVVAAGGLWLRGRSQADMRPSERSRARAQALWPYVMAGLVSWVGVAASGLPAALGLLPILPLVPHADRNFGLFAEAEGLLSDPLNRLAHHLVRPIAVVLFLFGLTHGGIDLTMIGLDGVPLAAPVLWALWVGKPVGLILGLTLGAMIFGQRPPRGVRSGHVLAIALISGMGFVVPLIGLDSALPPGTPAEAARAAFAVSLLMGGFVLLLGQGRRRRP